ncbi:hypothetical protein ACRAWD_23970 [Caulobacter segnis]
MIRSHPGRRHPEPRPGRAASRRRKGWAPTSVMQVIRDRSQDPAGPAVAWPRPRWLLDA